MRVRDTLLKIAAGALCVVLAAILIALFFMNRVRNQERAENLMKQSEELKKQEERKKEAAVDLYEELAADLSVRSIICWGDNEMAGNGDLSLPKALTEVANEKLFGEVTTEFAAAMDKEADPVLSVTVNNMGVRNEGMREILARSGVNELQVGEWTVLPSDTEPHNLTFKDDVSWSALHFAEQSEARFGGVRIGDIEGSLTVGDGEYDDDHPRFALVRDEEGESASFGAGTQIETASAVRYIGDIPVFFFEDDSADSVDSIDAFVEDLGDLVWRYTEYDAEEAADDGGLAAEGAAEASAEASTEAAAAESEEAAEASTEAQAAEAGEEAEADGAAESGEETAEGSTGETSGSESTPVPETASRGYVLICTAEEGSDLDIALQEAFGDNYIRNDTYAYEMSEESYKSLAEKVFEKLDGQGCFDEVKKQTLDAAQQLKNL